MLEEEKIPEGNAGLAPGELRIFSLHLDFPASVCARWAASTIATVAGDHWTCSSEMWQMESLHTAGSIRKMLTDQAVKADLLIVAASSLDRRERELIQWLESLTAGRPGPGLLLGLFGDETSHARELDWTVKRFMNCARNTNRDFIWHWLEEPAAGEPDWLVNHIETFLARKLNALDHHFIPENPAEFA